MLRCKNGKLHSSSETFQVCHVAISHRLMSTDHFIIFHISGRIHYWTTSLFVQAHLGCQLTGQGVGMLYVSGGTILDWLCDSVFLRKQNREAGR